jgi:hypothetical protein
VVAVRRATRVGAAWQTAPLNAQGASQE